MKSAIACRTTRNPNALCKFKLSTNRRTQLRSVGATYNVTWLLNN